MKTQRKVTITRLTELAPRPSTVDVGYQVQGSLLADVALDEPMQLSREIRNGVVMPGLFITSPVTRVEWETSKSSLVYTGNSVYRVERI